MKRVGFWLRSVAFLIDTIIVIILFGGVAIAFDLPERAAQIVFAALWLAVLSLDAFAAASLGKLILRLYIARSDGTPADRWTLLLRWSTLQFPVITQLLYFITLAPGFYLLSGFSSLFVLIGCLYAANDSKQGWHDQAAKTAIFRRIRQSRAGFEVIAAEG